MGACKGVCVGYVRVSERTDRAEFRFSTLADLLLRSIRDPMVQDVLGPLGTLRRSAYYGYLESRSDGFDVIFKEAVWVLQSGEFSDPKELYLSAFHFHRAGHDGHAGYPGDLPSGTAFGEAEAEIIRKLGTPPNRGGGVMSKVLKRILPIWIQYPYDNALLNFQFDEKDSLEMVTLHVPDVQPQS